MVGTLCVLAITTSLTGEVKVTSGYQPLDGGGMEYFLGIDPRSMPEVRANGYVHQIPAEVTDLRRVTVFNGYYTLPKVPSKEKPPVNRPPLDPNLTIPIVEESPEVFDNEGIFYDIPPSLYNARKIDIRIGKLPEDVAQPANAAATSPATGTELPLTPVDSGTSAAPAGATTTAPASQQPTATRAPAGTGTPDTAAKQPPSSQWPGPNSPTQPTSPLQPNPTQPTGSGTNGLWPNLGFNGGDQPANVPPGQYPQQLQSNSQNPQFDPYNRQYPPGMGTSMYGNNQWANYPTGVNPMNAARPFGDPNQPPVMLAQSGSPSPGDTPSRSEGRSKKRPAADDEDETEATSSKAGADSTDDGPRPWGPLIFVSLLLLASLVCNVFLAFLHYESRVRYRVLLGRMHSDRHEAAVR